MIAKHRIYIIAFVALVGIGLGIAAFYDYQIDVALYNPDNIFAKRITIIGNFVWLTPVVTGLLFGAAVRSIKQIKPIYLCLIMACLLLGLYYLYIVGSNVSLTSWWHMRKSTWLIGAVIIFLVMAAIGWSCSKRFANRCLVIGLIGCLLVLFSYELIDGLKYLWGRQRFYSITDPAAQFSPWYLPPMTNQGLSDIYKSFPSGHSMAGMTLIWICLLPSIFTDSLKRLKPFTYALAAVAIVLTVLVMWSRLVLGMHFLSDTIVGASLTLIIFVMLNHFGSKIKILK